MTAYADITSATSLRIERLLPGPIERVWDYLVDGDKRGQWLASGPVDARQGGRIDLRFDNSHLTGHADDRPPAKYASHENASTLHGDVLACEPPRLLAFRWGDAPDASQVRFELQEEGSQVRLVVIHTDARNRDMMISISGGWHTHLDILADRLADRAPPPFWATHATHEAEYERRIP